MDTCVVSALAFASNAAMDIGIQVSILIVPASDAFEYTPRSRIAGHVVILCLAFKHS